MSNPTSDEPVVAAMPAPLPAPTVHPEAVADEARTPPELPKVGAGYIWFMVLAQFGVFMAFITPIAISLAIRVQSIAPGHAEYLGYITGAGALFVMLTAPFMGVWSDRTRTRLGRRRPFMIGGMVVGVVSLVWMAAAPSVLLLGVGWVLAQWGWGTVLSNLQISTADRLPESQRGKVGGLTGFATQIAPVFGVVIAQFFTANALLLFLVPGAVGVVLVTLFVTLVHEDDSRGLPKEQLTVGRLLRKYVYNPAQFPDFSWNWLGRFLFYFGLTLNTTFTAFFFAERMGVTVDKVAGVIAALGGIGVLATTAGALGGGFLSDRLRRRRVFLVLGGAVMAAGMTTMALSNSLPLLIAGSLVVSLGIGLFAAVDQALLLDVLPEKDTDAGRFMGITGFATSIPQAVAPLAPRRSSSSASPAARRTTRCSSSSPPRSSSSAVSSSSASVPSADPRRPAMSVTVTPVRFEHHRDALGIGEAAPRLSWIVEEAPAGWSQASYELESGTGETARVDSRESVLVPWPFAALASRERASLRVRVTGEDGTVSDWSGWAQVEAGLLLPDDWTARLITPAPGAAALVRRTAELAAKPVRRARVYATAHGLYQLEINGRRVGDDELAPGWTAYESRLRSQTYDVTDLIRGGEITIGAWLADGWWRGYLGWDGRREWYGTELGLLAQLEVEYEDGDRQVIGTDATWESSAGPIVSADLYNGEHFDARLFDPKWSTPGSTSGDWTPVTVADFDTGLLVAPDGPPVKVTETVPVADVSVSPSGRTILDFGQNLVGRLRITVTGDEGDTVVLRHAEVLEAGELATEPLRGAKATDTYVLSGGSAEQWAPRFTFHGFRYAEVIGWPGEFDPSSVVAEVLHSDLERTGWFAASDPKLDRLHQNIVWGMRGNFVDVPTDCPQRDERLGWTGDLQVFAPTAEYLFDSAGFLTSWLKDLAAEQARYGGTPMVVPAITTGYTGPMAGWADAATVVPWTMYQSSGDLDVLARQFDSMLAWVTEVEAAAGPDRIWSAGFQFGDWLDPSAPAGRPEAAATYPEIVATAYFARSARIVADAAALLGRSEAARLRSLADEVATAFRREYVSEAGRVLSDSATAYALALQFDLAGDDAARTRAADRLAEIVRANGFTISTGFIGTPLICDALSANGHLDTAYKLLFQTDAPSWLYTVDQGATTIWERWDSLLLDGTVNPSGMTSFNHYAFGAVGDWLHRVVAGLAPAAPGYRQLRIAPQPPRRGLTSASARLKTAYGAAESGWVLSDGELRLAVRVPVGVTAEVVLPSGARHVVGHGEHEFSETFEVDQETHVTVTVDTPLGTLIESAEAMAVLTGVITKHVPEAAEHMEAGLRGQQAVTPRQISFMLPNSEAVLADLERGFAAVSAGGPVPDDVLHAPEPAVDDDGLARDAALLTGRDFWSTREGDGIRSLVLVDGPHGVRRQGGTADNLGFNQSLPSTCFPPGVGLGSTWNAALAREIGAALGREARALDVDVLLGPAINIKRSPLGGRTFEYLSEDPRLTGAIAAEYVHGLQSTGVGASLKHFAVNSQETERMRVNAQVDDRALREIYLPAFEQVVTQAQPATVMSAYNAINGAFASENEWLLTALLRDEWGFEGLVVSDWGAIKDRVEALKAGLDLEMPGTGDEGTEAIIAAVRDGRLDRSAVERSVERLARLAERTAPGDGDHTFAADAHHQLARRAAGEAIVLLRNENDTLPLRQRQRVAILGQLAAEPQYQGGGSSHVNPTRLDIPLEELRARLGSEVAFAPGYDRTAPEADDRLREEAVEAARNAEVAVVFVGLYEGDQSEGFDRTHIDLPDAHTRLIQAVAAVAPRTVVVLSNGGVVSLEPWHDSVDAIVEGWALGQAVGHALAGVLTGDINPSGRLAETIPLRLEDTPSYLSFPGENKVVRYSESVFVGYRYYTTVGRAVRYPFGHGLSYTTFESALEVETTGVDSAIARVTVTNTGAVAGAHVVQLYVAPDSSPVRRPTRELAGFAKVRLEPGESTTIEIPLARRAFAFWDTPQSRWWVAPGGYTIQLGESAEQIVAEQTIDLDGDVNAPQVLSRASTVGDWFGHPVVGPALMQAMMAGASEEQLAAAEANGNMLRMVESMPMGQFARFPGVEIPDEALDQLIALSSDVTGAADVAAAER